MALAKAIHPRAQLTCKSTRHHPAFSREETESYVQICMRTALAHYGFSA
jgi:hypothetical protein